MVSFTTDQKPLRLFYSYAHEDERLRKRLEQSLALLRREGLIQEWHDRKIAAGQEWKHAIDVQLEQADVILLLISPAFLASDYSYDKEMTQALKRHEVGTARVIPIIVRTVNWHHTKFARLEVLPRDGRAVERWSIRNAAWANIEEGIREVVQNIQKDRSQLSKQPKNPDDNITPTVGTTPTGTTIGRTEPKNYFVDLHGKGDFQKIAEAVERAHAGERITILPGLYQEQLVIDKPLEIIGDGDVVIQSLEPAQDVILFKASMGYITNIAVEQLGGGEGYGVHIVQGHLCMENCDIKSRGKASIAIHNSADPYLRDNSIHDGQVGVFIYDKGKGTLVDNRIYDNMLAGVEICEDANPTLCYNKIHQNKNSGVFIRDKGRGLLEGNRIYKNAFSGVEIKTESDPMLTNNLIYDGENGGIYVFEDGRGTIDHNDIFRNTYSGVAIQTNGNPTLRYNRIHDNNLGGIHVSERGKGLIENNDIFSNGFAEVDIKTNGNPTLRWNGIRDSKAGGVYVRDEGKGILEHNDIYDNFLAGVAVKTNGNPTIRFCNIYRNREGILVEGATGTFENNNVHENLLKQWDPESLSP